MDAELRQLTSALSLESGTTAGRVAEIEREFGVPLPPEYAAFLVETNGGSGPVGEAGWANFYSVEELVEANRAYADDEFGPFEGLLLFGSDGGGEAFCFDSDGNVVVAAYVSYPEDNVTVGPFRQFMRRLGAGRLLDDDAAPAPAVDVAPDDRSAELSELISSLELRPGAAMEAVARLETRFEFRFPRDYVQFLTVSDGAEGMVGGWHIRLYSTAELVKQNELWIERGFEPYFVIFADDRDNAAFVFATRPMAPWITQMPLASPTNPDHHVQRGTSFVEFLTSLRDEPPDSGQRRDRDC